MGDSRRKPRHKNTNHSGQIQYKYTTIKQNKVTATINQALSQQSDIISAAQSLWMSTELREISFMEI
jgi:hypothetical protein